MILAFFADRNAALPVAEAAAWALDTSSQSVATLDCTDLCDIDARSSLASTRESRLTIALLPLGYLSDPEIRAAIDLPVVIAGETHQEAAASVRTAAQAEFPGVNPPWLLTCHRADPTFGVRVLPIAAPPSRHAYIDPDRGPPAQMAIALGAALLAAAADPLAPFVDETAVRQALSDPQTATEHDLRDRLRDLAARFDDAAQALTRMPPMMRRDRVRPRRSSSRRPSPSPLARRLALRA